MDDSTAQGNHEEKRTRCIESAMESFWHDMVDANKSWDAADSVDDPTQLIADIFQYIGKFKARCHSIDHSDLLASQCLHAKREARYDSHANIAAWCERAVREVIEAKAEKLMEEEHA